MDLLTQYILPCLWAFLACAGFCVLYNIHGLGIVICSAGGAWGWLVFLLAEHFIGDRFTAALLAGIGIAVYSEVMARIRKCPVSGYLLIAFFPLVPGAGIYHTMTAYFNGDNQRFLTEGRATLAMAGGLAIGVLLVSSTMRMLHQFLQKRRQRHASL